MTGIKFDDKKLRYDLLPVEPIEDLVKVLTYGANKYRPDNWKKVEPYNDRYYAAAMRHLQAWRRGEMQDKESGLPHLAHALCCIVFLLWKDKYEHWNKEEWPVITKLKRSQGFKEQHAKNYGGNL
jgi:hypothetical protein